MQLANVTTRLLASLKGQRDQENLFELKKASNAATFKKAQKKIRGTAGWSASLQSPGMLQGVITEGVPGTRNTRCREQAVSANSPKHIVLNTCTAMQEAMTGSVAEGTP